MIFVLYIFLPVSHLWILLVKFKDRTSGLDCDLNVNERLGIINSDMIKEYCDNSRVLRPLLFSIKEWAKPLQLNSPSGVGIPASFSSYAFALMTITFLQVSRCSFFVLSVHAFNLVDLCRAKGFSRICKRICRRFLLRKKIRCLCGRRNLVEDGMYGFAN